jgi:hypothetical protein
MGQQLGQVEAEGQVSGGGGDGRLNGADDFGVGCHLLLNQARAPGRPTARQDSTTAQRGKAPPFPL